MHKHSTESANVIKRASVRSVACPKCGAEPYAKCIGTHGLRSASHVQRQQLYSRKVVRDPHNVACQKCGAAVGSRCVSTLGRERKSASHAERVRLAKESDSGKEHENAAGAPS